MSNMFLNPSKIEDGNNQSPPAYWNAVEGFYEFFGSYPPGTLVLQNAAAPTVGDRVAFSFFGVTVPPSTLTVSRNGSQVYQTSLEANVAYNFDTGPLLATDTVVVTIAFTTTDRTLDARLRPLADIDDGTGSADTYSLKAFVGYSVFADNDRYDVAPLGELSVRSRTYASDRALYAAATEGVDATTVELTVFSSKKANGTQVLAQPEYTDMLLEVSKWVYAQAIDGIFTADPNVFRQQLLAEFNGTLYAATVGPMVQQGAVYLPEYVIFYFSPDSFEVTWPVGVDYLTQSRIKLWFADDAFQTQFDEYEIINIAPIMPLDNFFQLASQVEAQVRARTIPQLMSQIQAAAGDNPSTLVKSIDFLYHDPLDTTNTVNTTWTFIIYGAAGDNVDAIKAQLVAWVLANSTHTREEWAIIFPDIFTATEFVITPLWNQFAVPNRTLEAGVYSPIVRYAQAGEIALATAAGTNYTDEHIRNVLSIVGCPYKSLAFLAVGGPENRDNIKRFAEQWPDYMSVPTTSLDFNRMAPTTQAWIMLLYQLLQTAETMTEFSDLPQGLTRLKRINDNGVAVLYVTASFDNVQYLVVAKSWLNIQFPPVNPEPTQLTVLPNIPSVATPYNSQTLSTTFSASGGRAPYSFVALCPNLVAGGINAATGAFNGTFNIWGSTVLRIEVTDADDITVGRNFTVDIVGV